MDAIPDRIFKFFLSTGVLFGIVAALWAQGPPQPVARPGKKPIPKITFKNLSPPFEDYAYFQGGNQYGFRSNATSFDLVNAWWLAETSTLVYSDPEFVRSRFHKAGLPEVKFFNKLTTQCYIANNDKFAIVAFRGSEFWKKQETFDLKTFFADLAADINIWPAKWQQGGKVHRGFKEALEEVWSDLLPHMRKLEEKGLKIWITGHSLGAALATLCADRYGNVQGVYTFGSPRVGNEVFREQYDVKLYRIVNNDDIVPRLLPEGEYVHVGELRFIDGGGIIRVKETEHEHSITVPGSEMDDRSDNDRPKTYQNKGFVPAGWRDHVPLLYAVHLWNNLVEGQP